MDFFILVIDALQMLFWFVLVLLWVTGGISSQPELSKLSYPAAPILILGLLRWKLRGSFLPDEVTHGVTRLRDAILQHPGFAISLPLVIYILLLGTIQSFRHWAFQSNAFDLTFVDQALWTTAHGGGFLATSISASGTFLGEHFSPILAVLAPAYWVFESTYWLFFVQAALIAWGAWLLNRVAEPFLSLPQRLFLVVAFLVYEPVIRGTLFSFREDLFFVPVFLGMVATLLRGKWWIFWCLAAVSLTIKENAPIALFGFGVWLLAGRRWLQGTLLCTASLLAFYVISSKVLPAFAASSTGTMLANRVPIMEGGLAGFLERLSSEPGNTLSTVFAPFTSKSAIRYLLQVLAPALPFVFFRPLTRFVPFLIALGLMLTNVLVNWAHRPIFHYELIAVPFIFATIALGFGDRARRFGALNMGALLLALIFIKYGASPVFELQKSAPRREHACLHALLDAIPKHLSVASQTALTPHLHHRPDVTHVGRGAEVDKEVVVVSFLKGLNLFGTPNLAAEVENLDPARYIPVVDHPVAKVWCRKDACDEVIAVRWSLIAAEPACAMREDGTY